MQLGRSCCHHLARMQGSRVLALVIGTTLLRLFALLALGLAGLLRCRGRFWPLICHQLATEDFRTVDFATMDKRIGESFISRSIAVRCHASLLTRA